MSYVLYSLVLFFNGMLFLSVIFFWFDFFSFFLSFLLGLVFFSVFNDFYLCLLFFFLDFEVVFDVLVLVIGDSFFLMLVKSLVMMIMLKEINFFSFFVVLMRFLVFFVFWM